MAAVTYWCQGKTKCQFTKSYLTDAANFRQLFLATPSEPPSYRNAVEFCAARNGRLAALTDSRDSVDVKAAIMKKDAQRSHKITNAKVDISGIDYDGSGSETGLASEGEERFWVSRATSNNLHKLDIPWTISSDDKISTAQKCLVLVKNHTKVNGTYVHAADRYL